MLNAICQWHIAATSANTGERCDRCQWQMKGAERVAAVGEGRRPNGQDQSPGTATGGYLD